jgi:methylthioribose-1-phosphate isomerase
VCVGVQAGRDVNEVCYYLATSRPTAINLFAALDRMCAAASRGVLAPGRGGGPPGSLLQLLLDEARAIDAEDRRMCAQMANYGADLLEDFSVGAGILTHCNAGALVSGSGDGTALAVIFELARRGKQPHVFADETRPLLQGARLTMWELMQRGIDCTLICDSVAAQVMREGRIQAVVTGADRIAANGDTANKIGTYSIATLARAHNIPFYVAAPATTFDLSITTGAEIPIEQRAAEEITRGFGKQTAPDNANVYNPAFDVTPAELITAIITDRCNIRPVTTATVRATLGSAAPGRGSAVAGSARGSLSRHPISDLSPFESKIHRAEERLGCSELAAVNEGSLLRSLGALPKSFPPPPTTPLPSPS